LRAELTELQAELSKMDCACSLQELFTPSRKRWSRWKVERRRSSREVIPSIDTVIGKRQKLHQGGRRRAGGDGQGAGLPGTEQAAS